MPVVTFLRHAYTFRRVLTRIHHLSFSAVDIEVLHRPLGLGQVIKLAPCALVLANLYAQYYYAITTPPGNPYDILPEIQRLAPWLIDRQTNRVNGHGSSGHETSIASNSRDIEVRSLVRGDGYPGSRLRRCGKCRGPKPIVSRLL